MATTTGVSLRRRGTVALLARTLGLVVFGGVIAAWLPGEAGGAGFEQAALPVVVAFLAGAPSTPVTVWVAGSDGQEVTATVPAGTTEITVTAVVPPPWRLGARCPGFWSSPRNLAEPPTAPVQLELWPAAELALAAHLPPGEEAPEELEVVLTPAHADTAGQPKVAEARCPLEKGKAQGCLVPAGTWHLRLQVGTLAPHLAWNVTLPPGGSVDLGRLEFRPGATVAGQVVAAPAVAAEATVVEATPRRLAAAQEAGSRSALAAAERQVPVDPWGRFAVAGLSAGTWILRARQQECAAPPLPVTVNPPEGVIELTSPLELRCPAPLEVKVTPLESIPATGLEVEVYPLGLEQDAETPLAAGEVGEDGRWRSPPLPAGLYLVILSTPDGATMAIQEVKLEGEAAEVEFSLRVVVVSGRVLEGRRGVAAEVDFHAPDDGANLVVHSDDEGNFVATFPRPGRFRPFVTLAKPRQVLSLPTVEVKAGAALTLRLPHTRVRGEVRQGDGVSPAARASVEAIGPDGYPAAKATADGEGRFELRGLPAGRLTLAATAGGKRSRPLEVELLEGRESQVVLLLEDSLTVRCRVRGAGAGVVGAQVLAWGADAAGRLLASISGEATTGPDGTAAVALAPGAARVSVAVLAPGFALYEAPPQPLLAADEHLEVALDQAAGTLVVDSNLYADDHVPLLVKDGRPLVVSSMLGQWASLHGKLPGATQEWEIPMLPPGRYRLCRLTGDEAVAVLAGHALPRAAACSQEGVLAPGGMLPLSLPRR